MGCKIKHHMGLLSGLPRMYNFTSQGYYKVKTLSKNPTHQGTANSTLYSLTRNIIMHIIFPL